MPFVYKKGYDHDLWSKRGHSVGTSKFAKGGSTKNWIQEATAAMKKKGTEGRCTGKKFGGPTCPPGSKQYDLAKTFKKMGKERKGKSA